MQRASAHARVFGHAERDGARDSAPPLLPSSLSSASAPGLKDFPRLNGWPMRSPTDASPSILADADARLGADVDRYSFIAVDLHHLLSAGFAGALITSSIMQEAAE